MTLKSPVVFVLGAGFTKSFDNDAPLLYCDIRLPYLLAKYHANLKIIELLRNEASDKGLINIESLFTRLTGMPFDNTNLIAEPERHLLYDEVMSEFLKQLINLKHYC
jgi:hypothetical protein